MRAQICLLVMAICSAVRAEPNFAGKTDRALRYHPHYGEFLVDNGSERFNRPLYIRNSAMRVDAGDRPEFSLFLPGRGGNFRLGVRVGDQCKWLDDAEKITARYRPGEMLYDVRDPTLGVGSIAIRLLTLADADGYI